VYNDFPIINERELLNLKNAYNERLNKIKSLSLTEGFLERFNKIQTCLKNAIHYLENLINLSKNVLDKNTFKEIRSNIQHNLDNLTNLYEINEIENENKELNIKNDNNINSNLKNANFSLLCFLEEMFNLIEYENNIKIKLALNTIFLSVIEELKKMNSLIKTSSVYKVFSLFNRNFN